MVKARFPNVVKQILGTLGSIPSPTQWVKDLALLQLSLGHNYGSDLMPSLGTPYTSGQPKNGGKKAKVNIKECILKAVRKK